MSDIFISYSVLNSDYANKIASKLGDMKLSAKQYFKGDYIRPGESWVEAIEKQLYDADYFVIIVSSEYLKSKYCSFEMGVALARQSNGEAKVIPIQISDLDMDELPYSLQKNTMLDARELGVDQLAEYISEAVSANDSSHKA